MQTRRKFLNNIMLGSLAAGLTTPFTACAVENRTGKTSMQLPIIEEVDICILGGSCTGVFAGVRAARLGATVAIVEKQNAFGGVATSSLVNIWHSLYDTEAKQQIIAGLTSEVIERLSLRDAVTVSPNPSSAYTFNSQELKMELDELVLEAGIHPYLHTLFSEPCLDEEGMLVGVIVDNKSGRGVIKAKYFIDATGDGDLCYRLDIHHQDKPGLTFRYLDGSEVYVRPGFLEQRGRWRKEMDVDPTFYQIPLRSIIPSKYDNLMVAGRMLDVAIIAYSGIRVMVNMNQIGEAAGVTSYLALQQNKKIKDVSSLEVREELKKGGSIII